jgi:hypothetical protein
VLGLAQPDKPSQSGKSDHEVNHQSNTDLDGIQDFITVYDINLLLFWPSFNPPLYIAGFSHYFVHSLKSSSMARHFLRGLVWSGIASWIHDIADDSRKRRLNFSEMCS